MKKMIKEKVQELKSQIIVKNRLLEENIVLLQNISLNNFAGRCFLFGQASDFNDTY